MNQHYGAQFKPQVTPAVRILLIVLVSIFLLQIVLDRFVGLPFTANFAFTPYLFLSGKLWQLVTYIFLHGSPFHLFFNALALFMLGPQLESLWGTKKFLTYFFVSAFGGAILHTLIWVSSLFFFPEHSSSLGLIPIVGASGALYGLLMAYGLLFGNSYFLAFFVFPIQARYFVLIIAAIELISSLTSGNQGVAHLVHLGGLATGFLYLKIKGSKRGGGGGGGLFSKKKMSRDEIRSRLSVITNEEPKNKGDRGYPITWN
jgi:membrane associated rhomboid family serine protease